MILPIVPYGNEILRRKTSSLQLSEAIHTLVNDMFETMYAASGVGLAAPQIGKSISLFVMDSSALQEEDIHAYKDVFINPCIEEYSTDQQDDYEEGCLSIPGLNAKIQRPLHIKISYTNLKGERKQYEFSGINARIIQHEYDHLNGKLFIDYLSAKEKQVIKNKLEKVSKGIFNCKYKILT